MLKDFPYRHTLQIQSQRLLNTSYWERKGRRPKTTEGTGICYWRRARETTGSSPVVGTNTQKVPSLILCSHGFIREGYANISRNSNKRLNMQYITLSERGMWFVVEGSKWAGNCLTVIWKRTKQMESVVFQSNFKVLHTAQIKKKTRQVWPKPLACRAQPKEPEVKFCLFQ